MDRIKNNLFRIFSKNLSYYHNDLSGKFACPICLRVFDSPNDLSKAHILPKKLGGRFVTLVCTECNNKVGTGIEAYETERARICRILQGKSEDSLQVKLQPKDYDGVVSQVNAEMKVKRNDQGQLSQFNVYIDRSNPSEVNKTTQWLQEKAKSGTDDWSFDVNIQARAGWKRARLTYLQSAFLYLFHQFGYEWALDFCTKDIRKQIMEAHKDIISPLIITSANFQECTNRILLLLVTNPIELRGFFVVIPRLDHIKSRICVWMPLFGQEYKSDYEIQKKDLKFDFVIVPNPVTQLTQPDSFLFGYKAIKHFCL